MQNNAVYLKL